MVKFQIEISRGGYPCQATEIKYLNMWLVLSLSCAYPMKREGREVNHYFILCLS